MTSAFKATDLMSVVNNTKKPPNCDITLNIRPVKAEEGIAHAIWDVDESFINGIGVAMGGFVASAADITMAYAIASILEDNQSFFSINLQTTFHRPVSVGKVEVEARIEKRGRTMVYLVSDLKQNSKIVATVHSSVMLING